MDEIVISAARLREVVSYDAASGVFRWIKSTGPRAVIGGIAGTIDRKGYRRIRIDGTKHAAHRMAWLYMTGALPVLQIDHRNRCRDDNAWSNIRQATNGQNQANSRSHREERGALKGTYRCRRRFQAVIQVDGERHYLGSFPTEQAAHQAYAEAAREHFGEFARPA